MISLRAVAVEAGVVAVRGVKAAKIADTRAAAVGTARLVHADSLALKAMVGQYPSGECRVERNMSKDVPVLETSLDLSALVEGDLSSAVGDAGGRSGELSLV